MPLPLSQLSAALHGRYRIQREIGSGGMATVYLGRDLKHDRAVALKVLKPELASVLGADRFVQEIKVTAGLHHPNILPLFDSGEADGILFYAMPYVEGESLRARLDREKQLPVQDVVRIGATLARALEHAHQRGVIHRDIKPENVLLQDDQPLMADFGIALAVSAAGGERLTETGLSLGTPHYMSPEQATADRQLDARSDLYSLGCLLYEMLAGEPPHTGTTAQAVIARILSGQPRRIGEVRETVPAELESMVHRLLAVVPADRPHDAAEVAATLERIVADTASGQRSVRQPQGRRARTGAALAGGLILIAAGLAFGLWHRGRTASARIERLAVLPLENLMGDSMTYFVDGMHDLLIGELSHLAGLEVISRTSVRPYRNTDENLEQIAHELDVDAVVEGSVFADGRRLRVQAQLIAVDPERHLWAESYDREMSDALALQSDVTRAIASAINLTLTPSTDTHLAARRRVDPDALRAYMEGRHSFSLFGGPGEDSLAFAYFEEALAQDSTFALAYAGMADALAARGVPRTPSQERARSMARKAIELDPTLGEPYTTLGAVRMWLDWNWQASMDAFEHALELSPNYAQGHQWYASILAARGMTDSAVAEVRRAQRLDPLSPVIGWSVGRQLFFARDYAGAQSAFERVVELSPSNSAIGLDYLGAIAALEGRDDDAAAYLLRWVRSTQPEDASRFERIYQSQGYVGMIESVTAELRGLSRAPPTIVMMYLCQLGRVDEALDVMEAAYRNRQFNKDIPDLLLDPRLDPIRADPRYRRVLEQMGLPIMRSERMDAPQD